MSSPEIRTSSHVRTSVAAKVCVAAITAASWLLVTARSIPGRDGDRGVFVSMAERLAAGDVLYVDVWDNKEPLFFLTLSAGRLLSPYMDVIFELLWILACALSAYAILRSISIVTTLATLVGFGLTPLIVTGAVYSPGFTHLPSTALVLATFALLQTRLALSSGLLLAVIVGFKVITLPVALALVTVWFSMNRDRMALGRYFLGAGIGSLLLAMILLIRGELRGFIDLILSNIGYSQNLISDAYPIPIWVHLEPVLQGPAVTVVAGIITILAVTRIVGNPGNQEVWWATTAALATTLAVIAITGLWVHHGQILYIPAVFALILAVASIPVPQTVRPATVTLAIALTIILSGAPSLRASVDQVLSARGKAYELSRMSSPTQDLLAIADEGASYARLGKNTDDSHAQGLRSLKHPCYQFVQYTYDLPATLKFIPQCLPTVDFVIVDAGLVPEADQPRWNTFVDESEAALREHFTCTEKSWGRLCTNIRLNRL